MKLTNHCFILSSSNFTKHEILEGYSEDVKNITKTFEGLNFNVHPKEVLEVNKMEIVFNKWLSIEFSGAQCIVCFILTHGDEYGVLYGRNGHTISVDNIISKFNECDNLRGKPKMFFLQACRGDRNPHANELPVVELPVKPPVKPPVEPQVVYIKAGPKLKKNTKFHETFVHYSTTEGKLYKL